MILYCPHYSKLFCACPVAREGLQRSPSRGIIGKTRGCDVLASLPVVIHHECADPSKHGYLLDCLRQTAKYNENTVLLGSANWESLLPQGVSFVDAASLVSPRLQAFERVYVDLAPYYPNSLIFFRRLFLMEVYLRRQGLQEMILLDSDILVYQNLSAIPEFQSCEFACCIDKDQHFSSEDTQGLRWFANCGISYWTLSALDDFLDFLQDSYENHPDRLKVKYDYHVAHNIPGGVTEMSLLYLWVMDRPQMRFYNMSVPRNGFAFNNTLWSDVNYAPKEYVVSPFTRLKKFTLPKDGGLPIFYLQSGGTVRFYNIHFVGSAKNYMHDYALYGSLTFPTRCRQIWQECILHGLRVFAHGDSPLSKGVHALGKGAKKLLKMQ